MPLHQRLRDIPRLLDEMWTEGAKPLRSVNLPAERVAAMRAYAWPGNRAELRAVAERLAAVVEHGGNVRAAAKALKVDYEWLRRMLLRCGAIPHGPRGGDDE